MEIRPPTPELEEAIAELGSRDRAVWQAAITRLSESADSAVIDRLIEALDEVDLSTRLGAVTVLGQSASDEVRIVEALAATARDSQARVRAAAVRALGGRGEAATRYVIDATDDRFDEVRLAAVSALSQINNETTIGYLEKMAKADSSEQVRRAATEALTPSKFLRVPSSKYRTKKGG